MPVANLDSRAGLGSDINRLQRYGLDEIWATGTWIKMRRVRVVLGNLGSMVRLTAPDLDVIVEGASFEETWSQFLNTVGQRGDSAWLWFDVGRTRPDEITAGLDAPEDEVWAEPDDDSGE